MTHFWFPSIIILHCPPYADMAKRWNISANFRKTLAAIESQAILS
jgi:hypothetical protein